MEEMLKKLRQYNQSKENACVVFMFHRIKKAGEPNYEDQWSYDFDKFAEFVKYLSEKRDAGDLDVLTNKQAYLIGSAN